MVPDTKGTVVLKMPKCLLVRQARVGHCRQKRMSRGTMVQESTVYSGGSIRNSKERNLEVGGRSVVLLFLQG